MNKNIAISIIIPCYNGEKYIRGCLDSILQSKTDNCEIVVIDDGSTDSSRKILQSYRKNSRVRIYFLNQNQGPAVARNFGVEKSKGRILFFLDIDTEIDSDCLNEINNAFGANQKLGAIQAKLLLGNTNKLDTAGHFLSRLGFPYEVGVGESEADYNETREIFGARSAGMAVRKDVFNKIGGFDKDYLIYGEDTDLSWRVWLAGYSIFYLPKARVHHFGKSSSSEKTKHRVFYQGAKNNTGNIIKNAPLATIIWLLPFHILGWLTVGVKLMVEGRFLSALSVFKGLTWNVTNLTRVIMKRRQVNIFIDTNNRVSQIVWGQVRLKTIINKGIRWYKNV